MARSKTRARTGGARRVRHPQKRPHNRTRPMRIAWPAVVVLVALGAFLVAREQAQGPSSPVAPPAAGLPRTSDYHSLLVDPAHPERILLGTHAGLYASTDGGRTWAIAELRGQDAMNLARTPASTVWAAGHGVLARSDDGGLTWRTVRPGGLPSLDIHGFAADPTEGNRLYAAVAGKGLFVSTDGGRSFELASSDVGPGVFGLAVAPDGRLLAADPAHGIFASDDGGRTWQLALDKSVLGVAINPRSPSRIVATGPGILLSTDGGASWRLVQAIADGAGPVAWAPSAPDIGYVVGFDRILYRTSDGGRTWRAVA